jgi:hypothetical protein
VKLNKTNHSDYLSIFISLPLQTTVLEEEGEVGMEEEVRSPGVQRDEAGDALHTRDVRYRMPCG